ncbi:adenine deaminase [Alteribacter keqinensis]|uniref:Adenine deaminase n=1 Tax=Alteribacter keqinensis TaxID=2483800 RepID=A0A3M7TN63_9BACI|nr:adenine deaminase [Alteribacter keqinensis]RNA67051.1 adenine deaminase [Alteribacter keqinensis]
MLENQIKAARKQELCDLVIKNATIVDVFNKTLIKDQDVAIQNGMIVGTGLSFKGRDVYDAKGKIMVPGLIDAHVHIESSMMTPRHFSDTLIPRGVTTAITDPHEIANVSGERGIRFMLEEAEKADTDLYTMLPSSVPSTPFETAGAKLTATDLAPFMDHPKVLGLAEVMDSSAVTSGDEDMLAKLALAKNAGKNIDGHGAGLGVDALNVYRTAGIETDHECVTAEEAIERVRRGFYVMLREGSVAKDVKNLLPAVNEANSHRFMFCTDDKHPDDLLTEGSIDHNIRIAIKEGVHPVTAVQMATINPAVCFGLKTKGAVAPGFEATFVLTESLEEFHADEVYIKGVKKAEKGKLTRDTDYTVDLPEELKETVHLPALTEESFAISMNGCNRANIIEVQANSLVTRHAVEHVNVKEDGTFAPDTAADQLILAVVERHGKTRNIGLGIVKGLGLKNGAIATTIAHDSHNIIAVGTSGRDILQAVRKIEKDQGGLTVVSSGRAVSCPLPCGGLMGLVPVKAVAKKLDELHEALHKTGCENIFNPFLTLSFLALPVIPSLKLTDMGLFDVKEMKHVSVPVKE